VALTTSSKAGKVALAKKKKADSITSNPSATKKRKN
jgi:hypothetical protein